MKTADLVDGGFGLAPKFPQTLSIRFLLQYHFYTGKREALDQACLSLDKMIYGGIYDQIGGGFARYSTDSQWLVPHFEKMLYDNAQLMSLYSNVYKTHPKDIYKDVVYGIYELISSKMLSPEGAFYCAL